MRKYKTFIIIIVISLAFLFYWFLYKPSQIRSDCNFFALEHSMEVKTFWGSDSKSQNERLELKDKFYRDCLRSNGLDK